MMAGRGRGKIRPPRRGLTHNDTVDFDATWDSLSQSLREIHTKNASKLSFEQLYRNAYKLVLKKKGDVLYNRVQALEQNWLQTEVQPQVLHTISAALIAEISNGATNENANVRRADGEKLLRALRQAWEDYILCMGMTTDVLMYMDRVYCTDNHKPLLFTAAMGLFRDHVLRTPMPEFGNLTISDILYSVILSQIQMEREGDVIDKALVRSCIYMLEGLYESDDEDESTKLYLTSFEPFFLAASREFYREEGQRLLRTVDAGSFCKHTIKRINEETDRCGTTISSLTLTKIKAVIDKELIKDYMRDVIGLPGSGVRFMLDNDRFDELQMIYDLISRVDPHKEELRTAAQKRILELGAEVNEEAKASAQAQPAKPAPQAAQSDKGNADPKPAAQERPVNVQTSAAIKWVDDVLLLKEKFDLVLSTSFKDDQTLQTAFTKSFSEFINSLARSSEYLSLFFDENMKKGIKGKTENEVDSLLDNGITLLRYIQDKDMFERYYKRHLSRRLLMKRSVSMDAERQMVSKMKMEVGNTFTQRIEAMFKDMAVSEDLASAYKSHLETLGAVDKKRADLEVNVLTSTMWPLEAMGSSSIGDDESKPKCIFPSSVERLRQGFEKYYLDKHSGRMLTWQANMGTADIRAFFPKSKGNIKTRELNVSTYAMVILLLFNDLPATESLTCEEIQARTNIPLHDLTRNLQSLAVAPKTRVLVKEPMSKEVKLTDKFSFNESFYSPFNKVKIGVVSNANRVEDSEERRSTEKKNDEARGSIIEAAIVRIMKQRRALSHQELIVQVIQQLNSRFMPDVSMVKKRIEGLIEREYLERQEDAERPAYRYLA